MTFIDHIADWLTPNRRAWIYRTLAAIAAGVVVLASANGIESDALIATVTSVVALLGSGLAAAFTPTWMAPIRGFVYRIVPVVVFIFVGIALIAGADAVQVVQWVTGAAALISTTLATVNTLPSALNEQQT